MIPNHEWRKHQKTQNKEVERQLSLLYKKTLHTNYSNIVEEGESYTEMQCLKPVVVPEQARLFLPAYGMYVRWYWTASLYGVAHFLNQRLEHDAQKEIQDYAKAVHELSVDKFPVSMEALLK